MASLTIQIVGWNSRAALAASLPKLQELPVDAVSIRYLDNGSTDGSAELVRQFLPTAEVMELGENTGFARAHNLGLRRTTTPLILVMNPDVQLNWVGIKLLQRVFDDPTVAAGQGKLMRTEPPGVIDSVGVVLTRALNGVDRGAGELDRGQYEQLAEIVAPTGACAMYRRDTMQKLGGFDEDFFAYKEDVDLGWRLKSAGWRCVYVPVVAGYHDRQLRRGNLRQLWGRLSDPRTRYSWRNWVWMLVKNMTWRQELAAELFIDGRLLASLVLSLLYPPLLTVWWEVLQGWPRMLAKRR